MDPNPRLPRDFYAASVLEVTRRLLGMRLVRLQEGRRIAGIIVETEAYRGEEDLACHARAGLTPRTRVMYGPPGHLYVYFTYGMHWMLNFVTDGTGFPAAVLIRAIVPTEGIDVVASRRPGKARRLWTDGPAKLCQALAIDRSLDGADACAADAAVFVEECPPVSDKSVTIGPRVGVYNTPEPWKSVPWRFRIAGWKAVLRDRCSQPVSVTDRRS